MLIILCLSFLFTGAADSAVSETVLQEGEKIYQRTCSVCHADNGNGWTFVTTALSTRPRNFLDPKHREHLTRDEMFEHLTHGCDKTAMQPFKYQLYEEERYAVIDYIRIKLMKVDPQKEVTTHSEHGKDAHAEHAEHKDTHSDHGENKHDDNKMAQKEENNDDEEEHACLHYNLPDLKKKKPLGKRP